ncbi:uncharacterized protein LOC129224713 [Uloborus diversus]|uniref:uncharacterized protein LOC129224713 n=1 Tax=Uloborus diversus TaxID=327109 RepID=UPI002409BD04|nr:uncharacterized protein LOC129224713 [Uloborus diversus]
MSLDEIEKSATKATMKQLQDSWHEIRYDEIHNKPYLIGKKDEVSSTEAVSILCSKRVMSFEELKNRVEGPGYSSVLLGIRDSDSTVVFYKSQMGLHSPIEEGLNASAESDGSSEN